MTVQEEYRSAKVDERLIRKKLEDHVSLMIEAIVRGDVRQSKARRMVGISEGVMEVDSGSNRFEAAVQTDEGPKTLEGNVRKEREQLDIQSGPLVRWEPAIREADRAIRFAYENEEPERALKTISRIWEHLDRVSELAAARSRLLMGKVEKPAMGELPKWFEEREPALRDGEDGEAPANSLAVETAKLLIRAAMRLAVDLRELRAEVETGPSGRVIVDWHLRGSRLQWMVEATDLPWPSVKVYHLLRCHDAAPPGPPKTRIFHNAFDAVEAFVHAVRGE